MSRDEGKPTLSAQKAANADFPPRAAAESNPVVQAILKTFPVKLETVRRKGEETSRSCRPTSRHPPNNIPPTPTSRNSEF